jgi:hypothetical protein
MGEEFGPKGKKEKAQHFISHYRKTDNQYKPDNLKK